MAELNSDLAERLGNVIDHCSGPSVSEPEGITAIPTELAQEVLDALKRRLQLARPEREELLALSCDLMGLAERLASQSHSEPITKENLGSIKPGDVVMVPLIVMAINQNSGFPVSLKLPDDLGAEVFEAWPDRDFLLTCELRRRPSGG